MIFNDTIDAAEKTSAHLVVQGCQALDPEGIPVFRDGRGNRCALGHHLASGAIDWIDVEGTNDITAVDLELNGFPGLLIKELDAEQLNTFWEAVRQVHDDPKWWDAGKGFLGTDELKAIALEYV